MKIKQGKNMNQKEFEQEKERRFREVYVKAISLLSEKQRIRLGAIMLLSNFVWRETKEGQDYWERVYNKLIKLSEEKKVVKRNGRR